VITDFYAGIILLKVSFENENSTKINVENSFLDIENLGPCTVKYDSEDDYFNIYVSRIKPPQIF